MISDDGLIATCSHVIQGYDSQVRGEPKPEEVTIAFQATGQKANARVVPEWWSPANCDDIAILKVTGGLPLGIKSLLLGSTEGTSGHPFQTFGFPDANPDEGIWGVGEILDKTKINGAEVLQIRSSQVNQGFSGAPVLDLAKNRVVGVVTAILVPDKNLRHTEDAFLTPTEALQSVCHLLKPSDIQPYIGLAAFTESQAEYFFGRKRAEDRILKSLKDEPRFLGVMGPSGCGKSSIVQAGLIPRLKNGVLLGSEQWHIVVVRPGNDPFLNLESKGLRGTSDGLILSIKSVLERYEKSRLLLVLDQFEEFLVTCPQKLRQDFWRQLEQLQEAEKLPVTIIVVMRDDFFGLFAQQAPPSLFEWVQKGFVHISSNLLEGELRDIIEEPAKKVGLRFEEGLVQAIIDDVIEAASEEGERASRSTVLPLLESSLTQLWMRRDGGVMTHEAYNRIDRVTGSLTVWARETYEDLEKEGFGPLTRRIFLDLVYPGDESKGVPDNRQRKLLKDLSRSGNEERWVHMVVDRLADARLVTTSFVDETRRDTVVEIIHDSLIREWSLLQEWLKENRIFMAWEGKIKEDALDWINHVDMEGHRDKDRLLSGQRLAEAVGWQKERGFSLSSDVRDYLNASLDWQKEKEKARKKETQEKQRDRKRTIQRLTALSMIALILAASSIFLYFQSEIQRTQSEKQRLEALALLDASKSDIMRTNDGGLVDAVKLAVKSLSASQTGDGDHALREGLKLLPHPTSVVSHSSSIWDVPFSPDGSRLAIANDNSTAYFSPNGNRLATVSSNGTTRVWDASTGKELAKLEYKADLDISEYCISFSFDGSRIAIITPDRIARIYDASTGKELAKIEGNNSVWVASLSPDGNRIAIVTPDGIARVYDASTGKELAKIEGNNSVWDASFSPDGNRIATGILGSAGRIYDASTGKELTKLEGNSSLIWIVSFSPDGHRIATGSPDRTVRIYDASTGKELVMLVHNSEVVAVSFSPDGNRIATVSWDQARYWDASTGSNALVRIWDASTGKELAKIAGNNSVRDIYFSPDGNRIAITSGNGAYIHTLVTKDLICEACSRLTCNLTTEEWRRQYCSECQS